MNGELTLLQKKILDIIQQNFPLCSDPYAEIAAGAGCTREEAHTAVTALRKSGIIRRIGGSFVPAKLGYVSALAAARVEPARMDEAAALASSFPEVTHNYEREGEFNLWFTIIAASEERLNEITRQMEECDGVSSLHALPALRIFKIKVDFAFNEENDDV